MKRSRRRKPRRKPSTWVGVLGTLALATLGGVVAVFVVSALSMRGDREAEELIVLKDVRVQVLNGCGIRGAGRRAAYALREAGYDVVDVGNAANFDFPESMVIDRAGCVSRAREIARALDVDNVIIQRVEGLPYEATVIVGADSKTRRGG